MKKYDTLVAKPQVTGIVLVAWWRYNNIELFKFLDIGSKDVLGKLKLFLQMYSEF